jgi:hypothetical protein
MPLYDETNKLTFVKINYEMNGIDSITDESEVVVRVRLNETLFDEIILYNLDGLSSNNIRDVIYYQPTNGWQDGIYSFTIELYNGDQVYETLTQKGILRALDSSISWGLLAGLIGSALAFSSTIIIIILWRYRSHNKMSRRFRSYLKDLETQRK